MKIRLHLLVGFLCFLAAGCKKDDINYPATYYIEKLIVKSETRMFTHTGEITDPAEIQNYTKNISSFQSEDQQQGLGTHMVTLNSKSQAKFGLNEYASEFNYKREGNQFLFISDVITLGGPNTNNFKQNLFKHTNNEIPKGHVIAFPTYREVKVAQGDGTELRFLCMAYYASSTEPTGSSGVAGLAYNEFNEKALTLMKPGDKVAYKMYELVCRRR